MKPITSWETLLEVAHPLAVEKGWWQDMDRPIDEQCANFHAEISEAWEEYRSRRMETWYSYSGKQVEPVDHAGKNAEEGVKYGYVDGYLMPLKPEGFWVEIADLLVRLADTCGRYEWKPKLIRPARHAKSISHLVCLLHHLVECMCTWDDWDDQSIAEEQVGLVLGHLSIFPGAPDLWPIVNEKVAYNRTRPHRHGGKVA